MRNSLRFWSGLATWCLIGAFNPSICFANIYFEHLRNEELKHQTKNQSWRLIPGRDWYTLAMDNYLYKPWGADNYYHGNGYWVNGFSEFLPHPDISINLKLAAYNGASSYGYAAADFLQPFYGLTWSPRFLTEGINFTFRYFDLDRQTLGAGLLLEQKEMNGLMLALASGGFRYKGVIDGTGGFYRQGDLYYQQIDWRENLLGVAYTFINYEGRNAIVGNQPVGPMGKAAWTAFSTATLLGLEGLKYRAEVGWRNTRFAGLVGLSWQPVKHKQFWGTYEIQARFYGRHFADQIAGFIQHDYVSPEIMDKSYTEPRNILSIGDGVRVYAARADFNYKPAPWARLGSSNEMFHFEYERHSRHTGYFYKQSAAICPYIARENDCLSFYVANKVANVRGPPRNSDLPARALFDAFTLGIESFIYF